jgi:phage shock protein PspC (stress-responsive transcriptional regulator)
MSSGGGPGVEETFRDFWANRPRRPGRGRKIAGVAAGIGERYGIDPVIVRVVFVVSAFYGGVGVLVYLLGWLFLPAEGDDASPVESLVGRGRSNTSGALTVVLCVLLFPAALVFLHDGVNALIGLALVAAALYLLHRHRGQSGGAVGGHGPSNSPPPGEAAEEPTGPVQGAQRGSGPASTTPMDTPAQQPPSWDPLGAAPFAWDLPEPSRAEASAEPVVRPRRPPVALVTAGLALLVGGASVLVAQILPGTWLSPRHAVGLVLAVLGLGLVAGSFLHGGRGLVGLALPLSLVGFVLTATSIDHWSGAGNRVSAPVAAAQVLPTYQLSVGNDTLDLRSLTGADTVRTGVNLGVGNAEVRVPANADVEVHCATNLGRVDCLGHQESGSNARQDVTDDGTDGPGGPKLVLDVHTGMGNVVVRRD